MSSIYRIGINLLYINPNLSGGSVTYAKRLLEIMSGIDCNYNYIIYLNKDCNALDFKFGNNFIVKTLPFSYTNVYKRYFWEQIILPFHLYIDRIDLIHSLGYVTPILTFKKKVVSILDINYVGHGSNMGFSKRIFLGIIVTLSAWVSKKIITISNFSKREIVKYTGVSSNKIIVTYLSGSVDDFSFKNINESYILEKYKLSSQYIIAFSSPSPHKNILNLIKAYLIVKKNYSDLKLVLVGHQNKSNILLDYIYANYLQKDVVFTGFVPDCDINPLIANSRVFVFPSRYEGFGIPILDAQMCNVPIASSKSGSLPEVGGIGVNYFDSENITEMADAIIACMSQKFIDESKNFNIKNRLTFSWKKTAEETINVYREVLK